tara:strand:+ start:184 stop:312 length:129 start_codon:yes stop_codon:yes gene_type:complete
MLPVEVAVVLDQALQVIVVLVDLVVEERAVAQPAILLWELMV